MSATPCKIDDCDGFHCPKCQCHTIGHMPAKGEVCDQCRDEAINDAHPEYNESNNPTRTLHMMLEKQGEQR